MSLSIRNTVSFGTWAMSSRAYGRNCLAAAL